MPARDKLTDPTTDWLPSDELLSEQSYLVARGVRTMAHIAEFPAEPGLMVIVATRLEAQADPNAIPFVVDHQDGHATCGYAVAGWAVELYRWVMGKEIPQEQRERVLGLLLGYSPAAIASFEDRAAGRRYLASLPESASS